jgi:membrane-associated phospholipid phosphatase
MDTLIDSGIVLVQFFQTLSPALDGVMKFITFLGTFQFYMLLIPLLYWMFDKALGVRVIFILIATDTLGSFFKQLLHQPRPYWVSADVKPLAQETSYGIPSTHASNTLAVWGMIAYTIRKTWVWVCISIFLLLVGISRLYLAVHFPHDLLGGWLLGLIVLLVFIRSEKRFLAWWDRSGMNAQISMGFVLSLVIILLGYLVRGMISESADPVDWASQASEARLLDSYFNNGGALFGAIAGLALMQRYAHFKVYGSWWMRIARYALGMLGVFILYFGLDMVFGLIAADDSVFGYVLRYTRYGAVTFWVAFLAPWVFIRLKLALE